MAITTQAGINAAFPGQSTLSMRPNSAIAPGISQQASPWITAFSVPTIGVAPSSGLSGDVPDDSTAGSLITFTNPSSGNTYLGRVAMSGAPNGVQSWVTVYDRLWQNSGINVTITTPQTVNSVALTRPNSTGDWVEAWWQVYVVMGSGTPTVTLSYTNHAGTAGQAATSIAFASGTGVSVSGQFLLAAGDTGVRSIQTWTSNATFTSGTIGLVLRRRITDFLVRPNRQTIADAISMGLPRIYDDACLEYVYRQASSTTFSTVMTTSLIQG